MSQADERIAQLGYAEKVKGSKLENYIVYENKEEDVEVEISWDEDDADCYLHARSITREKDWYGHTYQMPMGLDYPAVSAFMAKIDEMRRKGASGNESE